MSERVEPLLALTIEQKGWNGDEDWTRSGSPAEFHLDPEGAREITEPLRALIAARLEYLTKIALVKVDDLDFTSPTMPTTEEMQGLVGLFDKCSEHAAALREMAPDDFDDEDDDDEAPTPTPEPEPVATKESS